MSSRPTIVLIALVGAVCAVGLDAQQTPTFRASVDLIAVDVQVVAGNGVPIAGLGPDKFQVSINGRRRKVVSAELVRYEALALTGSQAAPALVPRVGPAPTAPSSDGRIFIVAIDLLSLRPGTTQMVTRAAREFVDKLQPADRVGLAAFPGGPEIDPTTDHAAVVSGLGQVVGIGEPPVSAANRFALNPSNIVDITAAMPREPWVDIRNPPPTSALGRAVDAVCAYDRDPEACRLSVVSDAQALALYEEGMATQRLGALRGMLAGLARAPDRKTILLLSAGFPAADVPGARPDLGDLGRLVGQEAARANSTIYALHVDSRRMDMASASSSGRPRPTDNQLRDSAILSRPLDQVSGLSGGALFTIVQGGGESAFDRVRAETSSIYILGVEPDPSDRTGEPRQLSVRVDSGQRGTSVRARSWVVVAKPGIAAVRPPAGGPDSPSATAAARVDANPRSTPDGGETVITTERPVVPRTIVDELFSAYTSGNHTVMISELISPQDFERVRPDLVRTLARWRTEWSPQHAAFALDVALTAYARRWPNPLMFIEAARNIVVSRPDPPGANPDDDRTELRFHRAAVALLASAEGLHGLESYLASIHNRVALGQTPATTAVLKDGRLVLAQAMTRETQTLMLRLSIGSRRDDPSAWVLAKDDRRSRQQLEEVAQLLELAEAYEDTRAEALVRRAFVLYRLGANTQALALLDAATPTDAIVDYWRALIRGRVLLTLGRHEDAIAAFEHAAVLVPGAQTPAVALAAIFFTLGDRREALRWAAHSRTTSASSADPWPVYWSGSARYLTRWLNDLRSEAP